MDAAQLFKKSALFLAIALSIAAPALATLTVAGQSSTTVTIGSSGAGTQVSVGPSSSNISFTVSYTSSWFTVYPTSGTTPQSLTIYPSGYAGTCTSVPGNCPDTTVTVKNNADSTDTATITVKFSSSGGTGTGTLTVSTSQLTLNAPSGGATSGSVSISAITSTTFTASVATTSCNGAWLTLANGLSTITGLQTPYTLTVYASAASPYILANGTQCTGTLTLTPTSGTASSVNVTFNVTSSATTTGTLQPGSNNLTFAYPSGTLTQYVNIGTTNTSVQYYNATISSSYSWLTFCNGTTSLSFQPIGTNALCLSVNTGVAAGLATSGYSATVTLQNPYNTSDTSTINATLSVNGGTTTTTGTGAAPTSLSFAYEIGGTPPAPQIVMVNGSGTISVTNATGIGTNLFFSASGSGSAPGQVVVSAIQQSTAGVYNGSFTVTTSSGTSQSISVSLNVTSSTQPVLLVNPSSYGDIVCNYTVGVSGSAACNASLSLVSSDSTTAITTSVSSSQSWVVPTCTGSATPATCSVTINPSSLPNGLNTANLTITASGAANTPVTVPVVVLVTGSSSSGGVLTLGSSTLTFTPAAGSTATQQLSVSASTITSFSVSANQGSCTGGTTPAWLTVSPAGTMNTPQTLSALASAAGLANATTCNGSLSLVANGVIQTVLVTMTVGAASSTGGLSVTPASLSFSPQQGFGAQQISVTSTSSSSVPFTVAATTSSGGNWLIPGVVSGTQLTAPPSGSTTPATVSVSVNTSSLIGSGPYSGTLTLTPTNGAAAVTVSVTLTVASPVTASPTSLTFTYASGGQSPASQSISVSGGTGLTFSATAASTGNWLSVTPASGATPATLTVSVNPSGLNPSKTPYTGTITVAGTGSATGSTAVNVSLTVSAPLPTISSVTNAASFSSGSIAPGEIVTIFGTDMGPTPAAGLALNSDGTVSTSIGGVQVYVNGTAAPMVYASGTQISAVVPYELAPFKSASVILKYQGQSSNGVTLPVSTTQPGIFTLNSSGTGPGAIVNQNGSVNSPPNPAHAGDVVVIYMTGEGQTVPPGVTGKVTLANLPAPQVTPAPALAVGVTIDGTPARVLYGGEAPGFVSGVMQVNVQIPAGARAADLPLVVSVGGSPSQSGVTVSVR